ncbi:MAG: Uma2 family endonuclease [Symploca sp. SIO2E6]|nr:Uma2 family endonuclease [Symploca sp. SIO2E6]
MVQLQPSQSRQKSLPTMYDLPSEDPEESGLVDEFHDVQPNLLKNTCQSPNYSSQDYFIAKDLNLYYDPEHPRYKRPDWFLALGAQRSRNQQELRLSYVMWQEEVTPFLVVELLSPGTEDEDLGLTERKKEKPPTKWEVYEKILQVPYYVIYDRYKNQFRAFVWQSGKYKELELSQERLWLEELGLGLGLWEGSYEEVTGKWLRFYDSMGNWIPTPEERVEQERRAKEQERLAKEQERIRADNAEVTIQQLRDRLLKLGVEPNSLP